ncbi:hypothetical protein POJ06DRAFT_249165 [Lipomyces tetrasporus]|uniref:DNA ligase n=1 Tax=Lipomyces tetrasporus TaxID=54092 RepID=A0AAD7QVG1_9ASCO|nr:uncharacterized protein POJ06DRAFT_249165 [Lipomyces tetrasporus]KAJ8102239.1 hypothetical protein POJ06DRAFT_249165 [Lipomyces tetrasporus]
MPKRTSDGGSGTPKRKRTSTIATSPSSPSSKRTLDFFFANKSSKISPVDHTSALPGSSHSEAENVNGNADEVFARKLQAQFDAEYQELNVAIDNTGRDVVQDPGDLTIRDKTELPDIETDALKVSENNIALADPRDYGILPASPAKEITAATYDSITTVDFTVGSPEFDPFENLSALKSLAPAPYALLTHLFTQVDATRSRIKIINGLTNFIRLLILLDKSALIAAVWLSTNAIGPPYTDLELGIGGSILSKALKTVSGISGPALKTLYDKYGDIGDVAFEAKVSVRTLVDPPRLSIKGVYDTLVQIAVAKGNKSQDLKQKLVEKLLIRGRGEEVRYLTRTFVQHLRIGAVRTTMLTALARAFTFAEYGPGCAQDKLQKAEEVVRQCYARHPNYNDIVAALLESGVEKLVETCPMTLHIPILPMLGSITKDMSEMLLKVGNENTEFACEFKYDGQRAQIHYDESGKLSIFSRHLELMTDKYPDLVDVLRSHRVILDSTRSFILEGEIVAVDQSTGALRSFQSLSNRGRKDVQIASISVTVCLFVFDLMYLNGESLLNRPFRTRRELLRGSFTPTPHKFAYAESIDATPLDQDAISTFFHSSIQSKCEGIMVKLLDSITPTTTATNKRTKPLLSTYTPDLRHESWLKVKKDYDSAADSLDLVPIGGWHGNGRKSNFWSPVLLAVRDPDTGIFQAVCKCMTGFTDAMYKEVRAKYDEDSINVMRVKPGDFETPLIPEYFWVPQEVWEIRFADVTLSPLYSAAQGIVSDRGLSIRFPRFIRKRDDKGIEEASSPAFLAELYKRQQSRGPEPQAQEQAAD